jgi:ATP-dependent RNA helicase DDX54/DBP10
MPKRPRPDPADEEEDSFSEVPSDDDQEPDIFAALTGQKKRRISGSKAPILEDNEDDDEDLQEIIRQATAKRDVREGTQVVKKTKGKTKITKGEVGGGSFQSMGECNRLLVLFPLG